MKTKIHCYRCNKESFITEGTTLYEQQRESEFVYQPSMVGSYWYCRDCDDIEKKIVSDRLFIKRYEKERHRVRT